MLGNSAGAKRKPENDEKVRSRKQPKPMKRERDILNDGWWPRRSLLASAVPLSDAHSATGCVAGEGRKGITSLPRADAGTNRKAPAQAGSSHSRDGSSPRATGQVERNKGPGKRQPLMTNFTGSGSGPAATPGAGPSGHPPAQPARGLAGTMVGQRGEAQLCMSTGSLVASYPLAGPEP